MSSIAATVAAAATTAAVGLHALKHVKDAGSTLSDCAQLMVQSVLLVTPINEERSEVSSSAAVAAATVVVGLYEFEHVKDAGSTQQRRKW